MSGAHTPGPRLSAKERAERTTGPLWVALLEDGLWAVGEGDNEIAFFERRADAMLFKAAPLLFEAVREMLEVGMSVRAESVIWAQLRAALAAAQGGGT